MVEADALSQIELLAIDLALEAERAGLSISQIAKRRHCTDELIALAEQAREVVAELKRELHADATEPGMSEDELDAALSRALAGMLGQSRCVH